MKKFLKLLAGTAVLASVVPHRNKITEKGGSLEALLWKASWTIDPDYQSDPDVHVTVGFNNIFRKADEESELFTDDLVVDYCCDEGIAPNTVMYRDEECKCESEEKCDCGCNEDDAYGSAAEGFEEGCCAGADDEE